MYSMKRAEGRKGRLERAEECKGWLTRALVIGFVKFQK
jgi:hypothetical protein